LQVQMRCSMKYDSVPTNAPRIGNITLASRKIYLTRTTPVPEMATTKSCTRRPTTTICAYWTLFKSTKVLARSRPLAIVNGSRVPIKYRKFFWQTVGNIIQLLERNRRRKLSGNVFRFDVWWA